MVVPAGGRAFLTVPVPRGGVFKKSKRYLVTVWVKRDNQDVQPSLSVSSGGGANTAVSDATGEWEELAAFADTAIWLPGNDMDTLAITLSAGGEGRAWFDQVQVHDIPSFGIFFRFKVIEPSVGKFLADVSLIRRHRDTSHPDRIRHYFHGGLTGTGGAGGVSAGRFSEWVDLRAHLFGQGLATVGLRIRPAESREKRVPVRVALELAYHVDDGKKPVPDARKDGPGNLDDAAGKEDALQDVLTELMGDAINADAVETAHVFFRTERVTDNGVLGFLMPESDRPADRFLSDLVSLEEDVERRHRWITALGEPSVSGAVPHRILTGANFFGVDQLVSVNAARLEADLLARIGIRVCSDPRFKEARRALYGQDAPVEFLYARLDPSESGLSPYDSDALAVRLEDKYKALASSLKAVPENERPAATYIELQDEPGNLSVGAADQPAFRTFLRNQGVTPAMIGATDWPDVYSHGFAPATSAPPAVPDGPARGLAGGADAEDVERLLEEPDLEGPDATAAAEQAALDAVTLSLEQRRLLYYTRLFASRKTADLFAAATRAVKKHVPNASTLVNFRSGVRRLLTPETADWFQIGRQRAVDVMWNEDWVNTYGWRRDGIQSVSYYTELMRAAARKHDLPVGGFLMCFWGQAERKAWSALAHGSRFIHFWRYGPHYANYLPYSWSGSSNTVMAISRFCRDVARLEPTLADARRAPAPVALLYAKSDPLWGRGQTEHRMLFFALLHDQIPVDLVTEAEIEEDGLLDRYEFLYVGDISVRRATLEKIADWVRRGGRLWLSAGAATRDEFNEPAEVLPAPRLAPAADGGPAQTVHASGKGLIAVHSFQPGLSYASTLIRERGQLQRGWETDRRRWITGFALEHGLARPVWTDVPCVEAILYRHPDQDTVMLINYTGEAELRAVGVTVRVADRVTAVESLRHGPLAFRQADGEIRFTTRLTGGDAVLVRHDGNSRAPDQ